MRTLGVGNNEPAPSSRAHVLSGLALALPLALSTQAPAAPDPSPGRVKPDLFARQGPLALVALRRYVETMDATSIQITVDVPAEVANGADRTALAREVLVLLVLERCRRRELSPALGARLLGLGRVAFLDLCAEHGIDLLRYQREDLALELSDIHALGH